LKLFKIKNTLFGVEFNYPLRKMGKSWELVFSVRSAKTVNTVGKGRAVVSAYVLEFPFISIIVQNIKKKVSLVDDIQR
jgi:hypothetical protein